jgi:hypothetical protein
MNGCEDNLILGLNGFKKFDNMLFFVEIMIERRNLKNYNLDEK